MKTIPTIPSLFPDLGGMFKNAGKWIFSGGTFSKKDYPARDIWPHPRFNPDGLPRKPLPYINVAGNSDIW